MKNFSGVCQAAGADKPLRAFFIWITNIVTFWLQKRLTLPWSAQEDRRVYSLFAASRIPRVYVVDRSGRVRSIFHDNPVPSREELSAALDAVLAE